jgi:hypothetical protein
MHPESQSYSHKTGIFLKPSRVFTQSLFRKWLKMVFILLLRFEDSFEFRVCRSIDNVLREQIVGATLQDRENVAMRFIGTNNFGLFSPGMSEGNNQQLRFSHLF